MKIFCSKLDKVYFNLKFLYFKDFLKMICSKWDKVYFNLKFVYFKDFFFKCFVQNGIKFIIQLIVMGKKPILQLEQTKLLKLHHI